MKRQPLPPLFDAICREFALSDREKRNMLTFIRSNPSMEKNAVLRQFGLLDEVKWGPVEIAEQEQLLQLFSKEPRVFYDAKENVHDSTVNATTIAAARALIDAYPRPRGLFVAELEPYARDATALRKAFHRILVQDESLFGYDRPFTLREALQATMHFIGEQTPDTRGELLAILAAELERQSSTCATGYLSAMVSAIQGFQTQFTIRLAVEEEMFARVSKYIRDAIKKENQHDVLDHPARLRAYVDGKRARLADDLAREYAGVLSRGDLDTKLARALEKYLQ